MEEYLKKLENAKTVQELEDLRISFLGKNGVLTQELKTLGSLPEQERKEKGALLNKIRIEFEQAFATKKQGLELKELNEKISGEYCDLTLPVNTENFGTLHPITQGINEISAIFGKLGFELATGPDIDDDWHNFTALNIPAYHPARARNASFYLKDSENMLRTETSTVQIRKMEQAKGPVKIFCPGRVYRVDMDATHAPMFHQCEGLVVDKDITLCNLISVLQTFLKSFFCVDDVPIRIRQHYFPFTEPSIEIDVLCERKDGKIIIGQGNSYMELLGAGMVHPNVLRNCGIDPNVYQGFAFGMGIDRLLMVKYGMPDLRAFAENDIRWLKHYGFSHLTTPSQTEGL
ncbi:MAG: phenylalanine--tRNA ligase subunit alpha [Rickettsiales bacterium]|nr:phenylalanine--tRNA ligase subunit alpha [Rickettsiales bacterium]